MNKKAIMFIDYNETFDDVAEGKGNIFISALKRFFKHFDGQVKVVVITSARNFTGNYDFSIKSDLIATLSRFPSDIRTSFSCLVEGDCNFITPIIHDCNDISYGKTQFLTQTEGSKKLGVELALKILDKNQEYTTCVFAGDNEDSDLVMLDADVGQREKYFLLANRRILKAPKYPVYRISLKIDDKFFNYGKDIKENPDIKPNSPLIIKTSNQSYGVGKGLEALTCYLQEIDKQI